MITNIKILLLIYFTIFSSILYSQEDDYIPPTDPEQVENSWRTKLFTGGNFGIQVGSVTLINISPVLGYRLTPKMNLGIGGSYQYYNDAFFSFSTHMLGYSFFSQYRIIEGLFTHAEYNKISYNLPNTDRIHSQAVLLGGGYMQNLAGNTFIVFSLLWNVLDRPFAPYPYRNPIIRGGINVGF